MSELVTVALAVAACKFSPKPVNGQQQCAPSGSARCPTGFVCGCDDRCYRSGTAPQTCADGGRADAPLQVDGRPSTDRPLDMGPHIYTPPARGAALVPAGTTSASANYRLVRTTGVSPGGGQVRTSPNYRMVGGLIGTLQK